MRPEPSDITINWMRQTKVIAILEGAQMFLDGTAARPEGWLLGFFLMIFSPVVGDVWFLNFLMIFLLGGVVGFLFGWKEERKTEVLLQPKTRFEDDGHFWEYCLKKNTNYPPWNWQLAPENRPFQKETLVFHPSIFRCFCWFRGGPPVWSVKIHTCKKRASRSVKRVSLISTLESNKFFGPMTNQGEAVKHELWK